MHLKVLIVDDEPLARRGLRLRLAADADVEVVGECSHGGELADAVARLAPDLVLLDVQMPGTDGFAALAGLPEDARPAVVFVTAYDQHAIRAFEAAAIDYLLKPVDEARLRQALRRVREVLQSREADAQRERLLDLLRRMSGRPDLPLEAALDPDAMAEAQREREVLSVRDGQRVLRLRTQTIRWIEAAGDYMCVHTDGETHVLRATLGELEAQLDPRQFQRVHRSRIVNLKRVSALRPHINGEYFLELDSGHTVKLSRSYRDKVELLR